MALVFAVAAGLTACGPEKKVPEAPTDEQPPVKASSARNSTDATENPARGEYAGWGAHAGTTDILARLAECNKEGHYFDRAAAKGSGECVTTKNVLGNCNTFDSVKELTNMNEAQIREVESLFAAGKVLDGFLFDQCVEAGQEVHVQLVKQLEDGRILVNQLDIQKPQ